MNCLKPGFDKVISIIHFLGYNVPTTQSFLTYTLLAIVYGGIVLYRRPTIKVSIEVSSFTLMFLLTSHWIIKDCCRASGITISS